MVSLTVVGSFFALGTVMGAILRYELELPAQLSLLVVLPALLLGAIGTYLISAFAGIPLWSVVIALCLVIVLLAVIAEA